MGRQFFKPRSNLKNKKHLFSPRALLFLYLQSGGAQKQHYLELLQKQLGHCKCTSMADFAYLAVTREHLADVCYRECREQQNGKLSIYYGGIIKGRIVSNYGHMVIAIKQPKRGKKKPKMEIEYNRPPRDSWDNLKTWTIGRREFHRLTDVLGIQSVPA